MRSTRTRAAALARLLLVGTFLAVLFPAFPIDARQDSGEQPQDVAEEKPPPIVIERVAVAPENPGPETLCRLTVTLHNHGERPLSAFGFDVTVAGHPLPVYDKQLFLQALGAGETVELPLYNFWTSETGRPAPADGEMPVEVTLREARWMKMGEEDGVEVWELEDPVERLPVSAKTVISLEKK